MVLVLNFRMTDTPSHVLRSPGGLHLSWLGHKMPQNIALGSISMLKTQVRVVGRIDHLVSLFPFVSWDTKW